MESIALLCDRNTPRALGCLLPPTSYYHYYEEVNNMTLKTSKRVQEKANLRQGFLGSQTHPAKFCLIMQAVSLLVASIN